MWLVLDVLIAAEEHCVEERGAELAHAAAHVHGAVTAVDLAVDDRPVAHVALRLGALANLLVDRERPAGPHDRVVDCAGHRLDVGDPGLSGRVSCGETGHQSERTPGLDLFGGDARFDVVHDRENSTASVERCVVNRPSERIDVDTSPVLGWSDGDPTGGDTCLNLNLDRGLFEHG